MTRLCPVCQSDYRELIYSHETTMRGHQDVYACLECGMIYSSVGNPVDYSQSIYSEPQATGSGDSPDDLKRLDETAEVIAPYLNKSAKILDVGCSQGGMLAALHKKGFTELIGIDLNHSCCDATIKRGFKAVPVGLQDIDGKFDCIIFSHVLEHVGNPGELLRTALSKLEREGILYIEVPDASKYLDYSGRAPFLDFNSEHINHFTFYSLYCLLGECGLESWDKRKKTLTISSGIDYPAR